MPCMLCLHCNCGSPTLIYHVRKLLIDDLHHPGRVLPRKFERWLNCSSISKIYEYFMKFALFSTGKLALVVVILE